MNHHDQVTAARIKKLEREMDTVNKRLIELAQEMNRRTMQLAQQQQAAINGLNNMAHEVSSMKDDLLR